MEQAPPLTAAAFPGDSRGGKTRISSSGAKDCGAKTLGPAEQLGAALRHGGFALLFQRNRLGWLSVLPSQPAPARRESSRAMEPCCETQPAAGRDSSSCAPKEGLEQLPGSGEAEEGGSDVRSCSSSIVASRDAAKQGLGLPGSCTAPSIPARPP